MGNATHRQIIALDYLSRAKADFDQAALTRIRYALTARSYGCTFQSIADRLDITESAVRQMVERHGGDI